MQISEDGVSRATRTRRWKYAMRAAPGAARGNRDADRYAEECLYDLLADPHELNNLIGKVSHAEVAAVMRERLLRHMRRAGESEPRIDLAPPTPAGQATLQPEEIQA